MTAMVTPAKKELTQKNIRMSSTIVMTRPWLTKCNRDAKGSLLQPLAVDWVSNLRIVAHCAFDSRATVWTGN